MHRSLLTELLVSDVEPLVSDVEPLVSDAEPLVFDVETTCKMYIASPLCPRLRRKGCVAQDRLLAEPRTVPEFVRTPRSHHLAPVIYCLSRLSTPYGRSGC